MYNINVHTSGFHGFFADSAINCIHFLFGQIQVFDGTAIHFWYFNVGQTMKGSEKKPSRLDQDTLITLAKGQLI